MKIQPQISKPPQPLFSCQKPDRNLVITCFVVGVLALVLGCYYLQGTPRIMVATVGAIFVAFSLFADCIASCCTKDKPSEITPAQPASPPSPPTMDEKAMQDNKLGAVLLNAIKNNKMGIKKVAYLSDSGSTNETLHQGYRVDFQVDGQLNFSCIFKPEIAGEVPHTIKWTIQEMWQLPGRLANVIESIRPGQIMDETFFIGIIEGAYPEFQLQAISS